MDDAARLMAEGPITRDGTLDAGALEAAVLDEHARGRVITHLAVGSAEVELRVVRILNSGSPLDVLRSSAPRVVRDRGLKAHEWQLREEGDPMLSPPITIEAA